MTKVTPLDTAIDPHSADTGVLLEVRDLEVEFRMRSGTVKASNKVSYQVDKGETLAIVGESGSGKTVRAQAIMGLIDSPTRVVTGGEVLFRGVDAHDGGAARRRVAPTDLAVFQDPLTSLNPVFTVGWQLAEMSARRGVARSGCSEHLGDDRRARARPRRIRQYPHELSGGLRQRVMIAMALATPDGEAGVPAVRSSWWPTSRPPCST